MDSQLFTDTQSPIPYLSGITRRQLWLWDGNKAWIATSLLDASWSTGKLDALTPIIDVAFIAHGRFYFESHEFWDTTHQ